MYEKQEEPMSGGGKRALAICFVSVICLVLISGVALGKNKKKADEPGMSGLTGWYGQSAWYNEDRKINVATGVDINGEVGHPLNVGGPGAWCIGAGGARENWTGNQRVGSGQLPPGMDFESRLSWCHARITLPYHRQWQGC